MPNQSNESNVDREAMLQIGREAPETRLFRNNTGMAWQGEKIHSDAHSIVLANPRPIHLGLIKGGSDRIGFTSIVITTEMVGRKVAVFTAIEVKKHPKAKRSDDQILFVNNVARAGGIAGFASNGDEAVRIIKSYK